MKVIKKQQHEEYTIAPRQEDVASLSLAALQARLDATLDGLSTAEAARRLTRYGVQIKMVTGDQVATVTEIASQLGLKTHITRISPKPGICAWCWAWQWCWVSGCSTSTGR